MAETIEKLSIDLELNSGNFKKDITSINKEIRNTERDFKSAGKGVDGFEKSFVGLDAKIQKTSKQLDLYNVKLSKQKEEYDKLESTVKKQKDKLSELETTLGKGSDKWKKQAELVQKNSQKLSTLATDIKDTESNISKLSNELSQSQAEFDKLGTKTKSLDENLEDISRQANLAESKFNKLGSELNQSGSFVEKLGNDMNRLSSQIHVGQQKIDAYESEISKLSTELKKSQQEHSKLGTEINNTENELQQAKSQYGENSTEAMQLQQKLLVLKDSYIKLDNEIEDNKKALDTYQTELNKTQAEVNELANELLNMPFDRVSQSLKDSGDKLKGVGQSLTTGVTLPIVGAGVAATKAGTDFTTAMSKLQATSGIADKTAESYKRLEARAIEMGSSTSFSASDAADGLTYLALAGWDVETQIERIEPVLRAAEAGGMDLARSADLVTDSMSAASIESKDFAKYLDIVAQGQRKSNTSMEQMLEAYVIAGGMFKQLNIPLEESGALLGVLANRGKKGSEAGNALISVFANLITETGQAGTALSKLNISLYDSTGKQRSMVDVLKEMAQKLGVAEDGTSKLTDKQKQQYAAMVGGKTQFDTLMALLAGVSGEYDQLHSDLTNSNGALSEMASIMKDNLGGELESMKSALEGALINAFKSLEPVISSVVSKITDMANWFSSLDEEQQKNIVTIAGVTAAIGPLLMGVGQLLIVGGNAVTLFGGLSTNSITSTKALGLLKNAFKLVSGPAGIVALIAGIASLMAKMGDNETKLLELQEKWGAFGEFLGMICENMTGVVQLSIGNIGILLGTLGKSIMAIFKGDFKSIDDIWSEGWAKVENNTAKAMSNIQSESTKGIAALREMTSIELNNLTNTLDIALQKLPELTRDNVGEMADIFVTRFQGLDNDTISILRGTSDTMAVLFEGIYENMTDEEAHNKFKANMESMALSGEFTGEKLKEDISGAMNLINATVLDGSERLSKDAQLMFDNLTNISQFGMDSTVQNVVESVNNMSDTTIQQLSSMGGHWETLFGGIALTGKDAVGNMEEHIRGRLETMSKEHPQFVAQMKEQMSTYFEQINSSGSSNADQLSINIENELTQVEQSMDKHTKQGASKVDTNTKEASTKADINTKDLKNKVDTNAKATKESLDKNTKAGADAVNKNLDKGAKDAATSTNAISTNTKKDMDSSVQSMKQAGSDMYNGVTTSFNKTRDVGKQSMTDLYLGTQTSANAMSESGRSAASSLYNGVTTSTSRMADAAIADWQRIRSEYSRSITGTIIVTKKTVTVSEGPSKSVERLLERNIMIPDAINIDNYKLSGEYYSPRSAVSQNISVATRGNNDILKLEKSINNLMYIIKNQKSIEQNNNITINAKEPLSPSQLAKRTRKELETLGRRI